MTTQDDPLGHAAEGTDASFEFLDSKTMLQALQALKFTTKQILRVTMTTTGASFRCEDDGKVCQSSVFFPAGFFTAYHVPTSRRSFGVTLSVLLDALKVFAALPEAAVRFTHTADRLVLETTEDDGAGAATCMYAHLAVLGAAAFRDVLDGWQPPATEFLASAAVLREAVEDLEWPQGPVRIALRPRPFEVTLKAAGSIGELSVTLPSSQLRQQVMHGEPRSFLYAYKFMKAALVGVSGARGGLASRVAIDTNGLLKVVHIIGSCSHAAAGDAMAQHTQAMSTSVVVTYTLQPMFEDCESEDDNGAGGA